MPALGRLNNNGVKFNAAFANGPYTRVSVPSIHTSSYLGYQDISEKPTIASTLGNEGIRTACIGTKTGFNTVDGDLVFDEYVDLGRDDYAQKAVEDEPLRKLARSVGPALRKYAPEEVFTTIQNRYEGVIDGFRHLGYQSAEEVTRSAIDWLDTYHSEEFFLWIHYMEGHRPYGVHDDDPEYIESAVGEEKIKGLMKKAGTEPDNVTVSERELMLNLYDSDLRYCSNHIDRLFNSLEEFGVWEDSTIAFTSDHGEEFYDHGYFYHRNLPYDELINVPLILKTADSSADTVSEQRELIDVGPTICDAHDIKPPTEFRGTPLLEGEERTVISVGAQIEGEQVIACRKDGWKYISHDDGEIIFNLQEDPRERHPILGDEPEKSEELRKTIPTEVWNSSPEQQRIPDEEEVKQQLEALGYVEISEED
jgi:arylsulfatase A-like enzyme